MNISVNKSLSGLRKKKKKDFKKKVFIGPLVECLSDELVGHFHWCKF